MNVEHPTLKINWATHAAAKYACENWHYSKCMPAGKLVKIGVWENGQFIGAVIFGLGATPNLSKTYDLSMTQCCELCRVALTTHKTPVTRIIAIALKFLKRQSPGIRLIVSFADTEQGHHGGIYQGGGWIFSGSVKLDSWLIKGNRIHPRSVVMKYGSQSMATVKKIDPNAKKIWGIKHRYLMALDADMKLQIERLKKPYPKRACSVESGTSSFQEERGGESPTHALQTGKIGL